MPLDPTRAATPNQAPKSELTDLLFDEPGTGRCLVAPDGSVLRVNAEWLALTGLTLDEVLGEHLLDLFPDARDLALALHACARRSGVRVAVPRHRQRLEGRETWWEGSVSPVPMEGGGTGLLVSMRGVAAADLREPGAEPVDHPRVDAALRRRAERALRESESRYRMLFDSIDEGFCIVEVLFDDAGAPVDYRFLEVNRAFEQQTGLVGAAGRLMRELAPAHEEHWFQIYGRVALTGEPTRFENRAEALNRVFDVYAFRVGAPETRRVAILFNDISERKRADEALRDADRRKSEFLGVLSHELRNPLGPIRNSTLVLERAPTASPQARRALGVIRRQTEHLSRLVDDLLDVERIGRGKIRLAPTRVDLRDVVRETCDDHRSVLGQGGIEMHLGLPFGPVWVDADVTRISQVLGNLLHNAAKFTPAGGRVVVEVASREGQALLVVRDSGAGMRPEELERMFDPFAQGEQSLARTTGGLGLGLALVKGLVELHGGAVRASSEGPGKGTELVVSLPLAVAGAPALESSRSSDSTATRRVLIIEDNADAGQTLADLLELEGHRTHVAHDGREGIAMARELRPDVVLCDVGLPDMDGYEVARALRADAASRGARLIALTGYALPEDRERAGEAGFDAHLAKPPDLDVLARLLQGEPQQHPSAPGAKR